MIETFHPLGVGQKYRSIAFPDFRDAAERPGVLAACRFRFVVRAMATLPISGA
jgi:hypothetical protein